MPLRRSSNPWLFALTNPHFTWKSSRFWHLGVPMLILNTCSKYSSLCFGDRSYSRPWIANLKPQTDPNRVFCPRSGVRGLLHPNCGRGHKRLSRDASFRLLPDYLSYYMGEWRWNRNSTKTVYMGWCLTEYGYYHFSSGPVFISDLNIVISGKMYWLDWVYTPCHWDLVPTDVLTLRNFLSYCSALSWLDLRIAGCPRSTPSDFWDNWGPNNLFPNIHRYMQVLQQ